MDKLEAMRVFVAVADCSSFVEASRKLDLSAPAVTRYISALEQNLGVRLFNRTTRLVRLTETGQRYLGEVKEILERIQQTEGMVTGSIINPTGRLSITAPVLFGQRHIVPIVTEYLEMNPAVSVNIVFFDRIVNLLEEGFDIAIRIGHLKDSNFFAVKVGHIRKVVCASPEYIARNGVPQKPEDLSNHTIIQAVTVEPSTTWSFGTSVKNKIEVIPRLMCSENYGAIKAAVSGIGLTRVMSYQIAEELENGTLTRVLVDYEPDPIPIHIVYAEGRHTNSKIYSFVDLARNRLRDKSFLN